MDLKDFKLQTLGIAKEKFGRVFSFVDYGNVNYWYDKDRRGAASGQVFHTLTELADLYINAQLIKADIASIKETSPREGRGLDIGSGSAGQGNFRYNK